MFSVIGYLFKAPVFFDIKTWKANWIFRLVCSYSATKTDGHGGEHSKSPSQKGCFSPKKQPAGVILHPSRGLVMLDLRK